MSDLETQQRISDCGKALAIASVSAMSIGGSVNLPNMVAGCGRMSGNYLLRSYKLDLSRATPGQAVLSTQASAGNPQLIRFCASILRSLGTNIASGPSGSLEEQRRKLTQDFLGAQQLLEPSFQPLQRLHVLDDEQMSKATALAAAILIHQFAKHMDPNAGFGYAALGIAEGSQTAPASVGPGANAA